MALTLANYLLWDLKEAQIPFLFADAALTLGLIMIQRGFKAEQRLREYEAKKHDVAHEEQKAAARGTKNKRQYEDGRAKAKFADKAAHTRVHNNTANHIQQPKKRS